MKKDSCLLIGKITKTYGVDGEFLLKLNKKYTSEDFIETGSMFVEINDRLIPFFIANIFPRNNNSLVIRFDDVVIESRTKLILGKSVYVTEGNYSIKTDPLDEYKELIGFTVIDAVHGDIGVIDTIHEHNANPLFSILKEKREILIPITTDFIDSIDQQKKIIHMTTPDGLIEIYL